jgi:imidazolonepropionase
MSSLLIRNIRTLVSAETTPRHIVKGAEMAQLPVINNAWVLSENGRIAAFGIMADCPERADVILDATDRFVFPAWCDSHTHIVFAATREEEFVDRIRGLSYEEIARRGGGILNSARKMQLASEDDLLAGARARLYEVIGMGTGAIEIKSGYGLTLESEMKMLRVIRRLKEESPIPVKATFLGAHAVPLEYRERREDYISLIINEMLPAVAGEGLADYCDVFCDKGFFTPDETDKILKSASVYGLKAKIHANELGITGGVQVGIANNALSVDHLEYTGEEEIKALLNSDTIPALLPNCAFFLGIPYPDARGMIDAGLPVALASDFNPGSAPSGNMPFVISLACIRMKMLPEEAVNAATINGARAMELENEVGTVAVGKRANLMISRSMNSLAVLPYHFGSQLAEKVIINGKVFENELSGPTIKTII